MQTAEPVSQNIPDKVNGVKPEFEINVGKAWQIFKEPKGKVANSHPYFALLENAPKDAKLIANMDAARTRSAVRTWYKKHGAKEVENKAIQQKISISNRDVNQITGKPHKHQSARNNLLYSIDRIFSESSLVDDQPETKGRKQYKHWYYFKAKDGDFYLNVVQLITGEYKLHAITDNIA